MSAARGEREDPSTAAPEVSSERRKDKEGLGRAGAAGGSRWLPCSTTNTTSHYHHVTLQPTHPILFGGRGRQGTPPHMH